MDIRNAVKDDAGDLAYLIDLAGEGLPRYLWESMAESGQSALEVGAGRAAREEGGFSYTNARIGAQGDITLGMIVAYRQPAPYELGEIAEYPEPVRPLVMLEAKAPGSWYINAIATFERYRGRGVASQLMADTEQRAVAADCESLSLIVASENIGARRLYEQLGYRAGDTLPVVRYPGCLHGGEWILMTKPVSPS